MRSISTHVLDVARGKPAAGVPITIAKVGGGYEKSGATDADGRMKDLVPEGSLTEGTYELRFDTAAYFAAIGVEGFYPEATVVFVVRDANTHYHVPLLLSPYGYSTYRGS